MSIKRRLTVILLIIALASIATSTVTLSIVGVFTLKQNYQDELDNSAIMLGDLNAAALVFDDYEFSNQRIPQMLASQKSITRACIYQVTGALFASYIPEGARLNCPQEYEKLAPEQTLFHSVQPIIIRDQFTDSRETVGYMFLESGLEKVNAYFSRLIRWVVAIVALTVFLAYALAKVLQRTISHPLVNLAELAKKISHKRDFSLRAPDSEKYSSQNEVTELYRAFNTMLDEIAARERQLLNNNEELTVARDAAEDANRAKSNFLANVSHELRTPLNAIIGFSSIITNQLFGALGSEKYMEYAQDINESGVHLLDIINDILDLSKAEAGKLTLTFEEVNVVRAIQKCVTLLKERAYEQNITIHNHATTVASPIIADRVRFIQIVLNVLSNAVKFTEPGGEVHIRLETSVMGGEINDVRITIEDTGIGMSSEEVEYAFQSFGQIDSGLNRKYEGTGLGLPLTKKLIELHHGEIDISSHKGRGTRVKLRFLADPLYIEKLKQEAAEERLSA